MTTTTPNATLDPETAVGALVTERPSRARIFEQVGIDYCCGGKLTLAAACERRGLDAPTVVKMLAAEEAVAASGAEPALDAAAMTLTELADHIERTHHAYLKSELPRLGQLARKVADRHGAVRPWLVSLELVFSAMVEELTAHLMKEEQILFPAIRQMEAAGALPGDGGRLAGPISVMLAEHDDAGQALARMSDLSGGYAVPEGACNSFRVLLDGLAALERDLHQHIHLENNILFPRTRGGE